MVHIQAPASHYQSPIVRFGLRAFAVLLALSGIAAIMPMSRAIIDARASTAWPSVSGTVRQSIVEQLSPLGAKKSFKAHVQYDYAVNERSYSNDKISFRDLGYGNRARAEAIAAKYPAGATVTVHYSTIDPQASLLEPGATLRVYLTVLLPPGMIVLAVLVWRASRRKAT